MALVSRLSPYLPKALRQRRLLLLSINSPRRCHGTGRARVLASDAPNISLLENRSYPDFLFDKFATFGNKRAVVDGLTGVEYSYPQVQELSIKIGSALTKLGLKKSDVFAMHCTNVPEFPIVYLAVLSLGGIVTTVSTMATVHEMTTQLKNSNAKYIITVPPLASNAKEAAKQCGIEHVFVIGEAEGCRPLSLLVEDDGKSFPKDVTINPKEDVAIIPYSSGTTGVPKGVMLTHFNLSCNLQQFTQSQFLYPSSSDDNYLGILPFSHLFGLHIILGSSLYFGGTMVTLPKFEEETFLQTIETYKITKVFVAPPLVLLLAKSPLVEKYDLSSIDYVTCGGAPLSEELQTQATERISKTSYVNSIYQAYGMTETVLTLAIPVESPKIAAAGTLLAQTEGKVVDIETGAVLGEDEKGELYFRGPQVMKGYLNNPQATSETITSDGWVHTGDIGYYDSEKYFYCVDRLKEIIKYKGHQVAPAELEGILIAHPKIQDVAVIGIPDAAGNELPKAFVAGAAGITEVEIHNYINNLVAPYKRLRGGVEFINEIPKSASGKILRRILKHREAQK